MMVAVPAALAESERRKAELARARRARYEQRTGRVRHDLNETRNGHERTFHYRDYDFIGWDGEAPKDTGYSLFGSSAGHEVRNSGGLTTVQCFDLLLSAKAENPDTIFVWFGGRYDWDEITRASIPLQKLAKLKATGTLYWHGYKLTECEGKVYTIQKAGLNVRTTIYEITGWFHCPYIVALRRYGIGTAGCEHGNSQCGIVCECVCDLCGIEAEKNRRSDFIWSEIDEIAEYMRLELKYMPPLMERIRGICLDAGFDPRGWYGPSALARQALTRNHVFNSMAACPRRVNDAACVAFIGGRFEPFRQGIVGRHWTYDKNSAYMHAALDLPDLARGEWRRGKEYEPGKFGVYHVLYQCREKFTDPARPWPLPRRLENGNVIWPKRVDTWVWAPEAELVKDDPNASFIEAWIFDEQNSKDRPFAFVADLYAKRLLLQALPESNPSRHAEQAFKWALASIYGQLARCVGWDRKHNAPPRTHQIEWAGYILSKCRAEMFKVALACGDALLSIDTDSVTTLRPVDFLPMGSQLGEWKCEEHESGVYFQNGVYFTRDDGVWSKGKTRGMERRRGAAPVTPGMLIEAIRTGRSVKLAAKRRYVTTRMALNGMISQHGQWTEHPGNVLHFGGGGKRYHNAKMCASRCSGDVHVMTPSFVTDNPFDIKSYPHKLPWKDGEKSMDARLLEDILWIDTERIDSDDEWQASLVENVRHNTLPVQDTLSPVVRACSLADARSARLHNDMRNLHMGGG